MNKRSKAAKKAAKTRAINRAKLAYIREVVEPANRRLDALLAIIMRKLKGERISLRWNPTRDTGRKLKHGAEYGTLVRFVNGGGLLRVLPDGYKQPQDFHPSYWEPLA